MLGGGVGTEDGEENFSRGVILSEPILWGRRQMKVTLRVPT
jgi:hypothetical protein